MINKIFTVVFRIVLPSMCRKFKKHKVDSTFYEAVFPPPAEWCQAGVRRDGVQGCAAASAAGRKNTVGCWKKEFLQLTKSGDDSPQKVYKNSKKYAGRWKKMAIDQSQEVGVLTHG